LGCHGRSRSFWFLWLGPLRLVSGITSVFEPLPVKLIFGRVVTVAIG
jgi:hypothetical protein